MANGLLISAADAKLILAYGICLVIILLALIVMAALKRNTQKEMRPESVKKSCLKAKKYAEGLLEQNKGEQLLLGATKFMRLDGYISDAAWLAYQIVEVKKDIVFEGIANTLDGLATSVSKESENGYIPKAEYEADVKEVIAVLDGIIAKLDNIIKTR